MILEDLFSLHIRELTKIKVFEIPSCDGWFDFIVSGCKYGVAFSIDTEAMTIRFIVRWDGYIKSEFRLTKRRLVSGGWAWWFVCPVTNHLCKKIYCVNGRFMSRFAIDKPRYRMQLKSKTERLIDRYNFYQDYYPERPHGKKTYRGKPTPYGKRVERAQRLSNELDEKVWAYYENWATSAPRKRR